jgi:mRNA interferase MazF
MVIERGEIWWATLRSPRGSEPGYRRPAIIVQADSFNISRIQTVLIVTVTSNLKLAEAPGNVYLLPKASGLAKPSVANVSQLLAIDRRYLDSRIKRLPTREMTLIEDGLRLILGL